MSLLNTGIKDNLSIINGFSGTAWYVRFGRLVLIHAEVICPGDNKIFAKVPATIVPTTMQFDSAWLQIDSANFNDLIGSITVRGVNDDNSGALQFRNWNGGVCKKGAVARASFVYFV